MSEQFSRTQLLIGEEGIKSLKEARVAVFGIGGVGGYVAEALARTGIGYLDLIDNDRICLSNINRQIIATHDTIGQYKVDVMKDRILSINPDAAVEAHRCFYLPETAEQFDFSQYTYVVDAVDTVTAKIEIIMQAQAAGVPVISSMGAGNKMEAAGFRVADIYETSICPLARVMRRELKKRGVEKLKVVYSTEEPLCCRDDICQGDKVRQSGKVKRSIPGSIAFVPSVAGLIVAGEVVKDIIGYQCEGRGKSVQ